MDVESTVERLGERMTIFQVVAALNCLKKMPQRPPNELLHKLCKSVKRLEGQIQPRHIADIFHACGKLGFIDQGLFEFLVQSIWNVPRLSLSRFSGRDLGALLHGLSMIQGRMDSMQDQRFAHAPTSNSFCKLTIALVAEVSSPQRLQGFLESQPVSMGFVDRVTFNALITEYLTPDWLPKFTELQLEHILDGLWRLRCQNRTVLHHLANELARSQRLATLSDRVLGAAVFYLGYLQADNEVAIKALGLEAVRQTRLGRVREKFLVEILSGLGGVACKDPHVLAPLLVEVTKPERLTSFSGQEFVLILDGLVRMGFDDREVLNVLWHKIFELQWQNICEQDKASLRYSFAKLGVFGWTIRRLANPS